MAEIAKFKPARVWRQPLAPIPAARQYPQRRLQITRDTFTATVTFEKQADVWIAAIVPYCLTYMRGVRAQDFRLEIEKEGFAWKWL